MTKWIDLTGKQNAGIINNGLAAWWAPCPPGAPPPVDTGEYMNAVKAGMNEVAAGMGVPGSIISGELEYKNEVEYPLHTVTANPPVRMTKKQRAAIIKGIRTSWTGPDRYSSTAVLPGSDLVIYDGDQLIVRRDPPVEIEWHHEMRLPMEIVNPIGQPLKPERKMPSFKPRQRRISLKDE